jgi:peptide/nickel transport system permease protein
VSVFGALVLYTTLVYLMPRAPYLKYQQLQAQATLQPELQVREQVPNNPFRTRLVAGPALQVKELDSEYGLNRPWPLSFLAWLYDPEDRAGISHETFQEVPKGLDVRIGGLHITGDGALLGEWGISEYVSQGQPASTLVRNRSANTFLLVSIALVFTLAIGLIVGMLGAFRQDSKLDHMLTLFSFAGLSMPPFVLGLLLIFALAVAPFILHDRVGWTWLPYLPPGGVTGIDQGGSWTSRLYYLVLPVSTLVLGQTAWLSRHVRFSMLDVLSKDYIRTAHAKGVRLRAVLLKHAFRNAALPLITTLALAVPGVISGVVVVEKLFAYPGMGLLFMDSISRADPDTPIALILTVFMVVVVTLASMIADILYVLVDPRISYKASSSL